MTVKGNTKMKLLSVIAVASVTAMADVIPLDVNSFLSSAYRTDLPGPEVWTGWSNREIVEGKNNFYWNEQLPFRHIGAPRPGMNGLLHVTHSVTNLFNDPAVSLEITDEGGAKVDLTSVRNRWTPSFVTTHYRSAPVSHSGVRRLKYGRIVLKETKAVLEDNTFLAEAVLKNIAPSSLTCRVTLKTAGGLPAFGESAKVWNFATMSMRRATERKTCASAAATFKGCSAEFTLQPYEEKTFRYALAFSPESVDDASRRVARALAADDAFAANARAFNRWFAENVPHFETGNPDLLRMYLYRWFVVKRNTHVARRVIAEHEYPRAAVYESPIGGWYNCVIGLPVPVQIQEIAWTRKPDVLRSHILNWCDKVRGYRGYIQFTSEAIARSFENHPSTEFAMKVLPAALEFARSTSGGNPDRLPIQVGSWSTGAEYQPNFYQFTEPKWDFRNDSEFYQTDKKFYLARLIRLDTAVYAIGNLLGAARIAEITGDAAQAAKLRELAASHTEIIRMRHWDDSLGLFLAADPKTYRLADEAACYDSFAPYLWGLIGEDKYLRAFDKLVDVDWFWDDFPFPTCAKTCPMYSSQNGIITPPASPEKPHWYGCSWNGPTWHYANTLYAEAFGQGARRRRELRAKWVEFFDRWTDTHWLYGDRTSPRAAESFRAEDGTRCNGAWDYFHSSWLDPFFRYRCGIQLAADGKSIHFEPFTTEDFRLFNVPLAGKEFSFEQRTEGGVRRLSVRDAEGKVIASGENRVEAEIHIHTLTGI